MVAKVHPSTLKAAEAKGFQVHGEADDEFYTIVWADKNKKLKTVDVKQGLADIALWKMITLEHTAFKVILSPTDGTWSVKKGRKSLAEGWATLTEAWDAANAPDGANGAGEPAPVTNGEVGRSIVKRQYRETYKDNAHTNGDEVAQKLKEYLTTEEGVDVAKLKRFAVANGLWQDSYDGLNNGQKRMNVGNRLRKKVRTEEGFSPKWVK